MSGVCQVTGKRPTTGKSISRLGKNAAARRIKDRTNRWYRPNLQTKRFYIPSENRYVKLTVSTKGIKIINKRGIESVLADMRKRGEKV